MVLMFILSDIMKSIVGFTAFVDFKLCYYEIKNCKVDDCQNFQKGDGANLMWNKFQDGISFVLNKFSKLNLSENMGLMGKDTKRMRW